MERALVIGGFVVIALCILAQQVILWVMYGPAWGAAISAICAVAGFVTWCVCKRLTN